MASAINLKLFLLDKYSTWTLCCNTLIAHSSVYMYMLLEAHGFLINWHVISISDCIYPIAYNLWVNFTLLTRLILSLILHPGQGLPDVFQTEGGEEGCHQGVLKCRPSTVTPARLAHNLHAKWRRWNIVSKPLTLVVMVSNHWRMSCVEGTCLEKNMLRGYISFKIFIHQKQFFTKLFILFY